MLLRLTAITSFKLLFTTRQTYEEFSNYIGHKFPELLLGNGLISLECEKSISDYHPCLSYESYLLSVSQVYRLKNFDSLIRAFLLLKKSGELQNLSLVIVGTIQELDYYNELKFLADNRDDIIFLHDIKDDYLNCLYDSCKAYCFYSYFEGYSLTPAEAMLHNKHVAISKIPTHLEVYGEEPVYAIPADLVAIKNSILEVIARAEHGKPIYSKGFIERFSFNSFLKRLIDWVL
jgi:glycosyltransferase involved in cell wall biosynthesis